MLTEFCDDLPDVPRQTGRTVDLNVAVLSFDLNSLRRVDLAGFHGAVKNLLKLNVHLMLHFELAQVKRYAQL